MKSILRALALTGILGAAAGAAQAQVGIFVGFHRPAVIAAVPPCPGEGYVWVDGYYDGPAFIPGRWIYRGGYRDLPMPQYRHDFRVDNRGYDRGHDRGFDHGREGYRR